MTFMITLILNLPMSSLSTSFFKMASSSDFAPPAKRQCPEFKPDNECEAEMQTEIDTHIATWEMQHQGPVDSDIDSDSIPPFPVEFIKLADDLIALGQSLPADACPEKVNLVASKAERICVKFWEHWWSK